MQRTFTGLTASNAMDKGELLPLFLDEALSSLSAGAGDNFVTVAITGGLNTGEPDQHDFYLSMDDGTQHETVYVHTLTEGSMVISRSNNNAYRDPSNNTARFRNTGAWPIGTELHPYLLKENIYDVLYASDISRFPAGLNSNEVVPFSSGNTTSTGGAITSIHVGVNTLVVSADTSFAANDVLLVAAENQDYWNEAAVRYVLVVDNFSSNDSHCPARVTFTPPNGTPVAMEVYPDSVGVFEIIDPRVYSATLTANIPPLVTVIGGGQSGVAFPLAFTPSSGATHTVQSDTQAATAVLAYLAGDGASAFPQPTITDGTGDGTTGIGALDYPTIVSVLAATVLTLTQRVYALENP